MAEYRRGGRRSFRPHRGRRKVCHFCAEHIEDIDYKDVNTLQRYVSESGKILPRRMSGTCAKHQRAIATAVKRARQVALLSYTGE